MPSHKEDMEKDLHVPSFEELRKASRKEKVGPGLDIDLARPESWLNQYTLAPMFFTTKAYFIFTLALSLVVAWALACWIYQIFVGMGVTSLKHPVFWGIYISTFVFWVGVSHSGTMVSSILRLTKANWRRPILRGAEAMTAFSLMVAVMFPLIHVGRLWRVYYMFPLPNQRELWPNFRSPLTWDMAAILVYLTAAMTFLFVGLLPDIALARDLCPIKSWRKNYLTLLSLGWRGTHREWTIYENASIHLAVLVLLIAPSVHTIVAWDFAMTITPGWHTSIFGPYFVVGAVYSGVAAVLTLMVLLRWIFGLDEIIRRIHLNNLAKMLLAMSFIWTYFYFTEFMTAWYANNPVEWRIWEYQWERFPHLLIVMLSTSVLTITALSFSKVRSSPAWLFIISICVNIGMYIERYLIVVPALSHRDNPFTWTDYFPSVVEISIVIGALAYFFLLYAIFTKLLPIVTVADIREGKVMTGNVRIGNTIVRIHADVEGREHPHQEPPKSSIRERVTEFMNLTVLGLFDDVDSAAKTIKPLEEITIHHEDISLISVSPFPDGTLFDEKKPQIWLYGLVGGLLGLIVGVALAGGTQMLMNLNVGGKPPVSLPVVGLICYEFILLGAVLGIFTGLLWVTGLPDWTGRAYDKKISEGAIGLLVRCADEPQAKSVEEILIKHGAVNIRKGKEDF